MQCYSGNEHLTKSICLILLLLLSLLLFSFEQASLATSHSAAFRWVGCSCHLQGHPDPLKYEPQSAVRWEVAPHVALPAPSRVAALWSAWSPGRRHPIGPGHFVPDPGVWPLQGPALRSSAVTIWKPLITFKLEASSLHVAWVLEPVLQGRREERGGRGEGRRGRGGGEGRKEGRGETGKEGSFPGLARLAPPSRYVCPDLSRA